MTSDLSEEDEDTIVSDYISLMNEKGIDSKEVSKFEKKYRKDKDIASLLKTAKRVKAMFLTGELE
jgi:hypothetical protein